jgi:hypothetical protein
VHTKSAGCQRRSGHAVSQPVHTKYAGCQRRSGHAVSQPVHTKYAGCQRRSGHAVSQPVHYEVCRVPESLRASGFATRSRGARRLRTRPLRNPWRGSRRRRG